MEECAENNEGKNYEKDDENNSDDYDDGKNSNKETTVRFLILNIFDIE